MTELSTQSCLFRASFQSKNGIRCQPVVAERENKRLCVCICLCVQLHADVCESEHVCYKYIEVPLFDLSATQAVDESEKESK